jgi:hypothetical protein
LITLNGIGLYVDDAYQRCIKAHGKGVGYSLENAMQAVDAHHLLFRRIDELVADMKKRGGVSSAKSMLLLQDTPWKLDDAAWFARNQHRSHRVRPIFPGEDEPLPSAAPGTVHVTIVRQVAPGQRLRMFIAGLAVPDDESFLHAIFDLFVKNERKPVSSEAVLALAADYVRHKRTAS